MNKIAGSTGALIAGLLLAGCGTNSGATGATGTSAASGAAGGVDRVSSGSVVAAQAPASANSAAPLASAASVASAASAAAPSDGSARPPRDCRPITKKQVKRLFDRWNAAVKSGDPEAVAKNYAPDSLLLATLKNEPRTTRAAKVDYFEEFLERKPVGRVIETDRHIETDCRTALDAGVYVFTFAKDGSKTVARYTFTYRWDGRRWLISSHHSSAMPEPVAADSPWLKP